MLILQLPLCQGPLLWEPELLLLELEVELLELEDELLAGETSAPHPLRQKISKATILNVFEFIGPSNLLFLQRP